MKIQNTIIVVTLTAALGFVAGCGNQGGSDNSGSPVSTNTESSAPAAAANALATDASKAVEGAVEQAKPVADSAVQETKQAVTTATTAANAAGEDLTAKANTLIEKAKSLVGESKYTEALNTLQQLASFKLTPEQQQLVTSLKEQIQKAIAAKTATGG